jgi:spore maturation protein CgeB
MRIIVLGPKDGQTWNYIADTFKYETEYLGQHSVYHLDNRTALTTLPAVLKETPDLVIMSREANLLPISIYLRKLFPETKQVCWNVDARPDVENFGPKLLRLFNQMDIFYTVAEGNVDQYKELCPDTVVKWLPEGAYPPLHMPVALTEEDHAKYDCEVMFAGDYMGPWHQDRQRILDTIAKHFDLKVYSTHNGNYVKNQEHSKACQCASICIAITHSPQIHKYQSARNWRIMCAGGLMLARNSSGIDEMFPAGTYGLFNDENDIVDEIRYWLEHPEIRDTSSKAGMEWVIRSQTFKHRAMEIFKHITDGGQQ